MTKYFVKTTYPADESVDGAKTATTKRIETIDDAETGDVLSLFRDYRNAGYKVNTSFKTPDDDGADDDASPFEVAKALTKAGVDYKATLKIKTKGAYDDMKHAFKLVEAAGFDMTVAIQLKINETTAINIDDPDTYQDPDAVFKCTPKANSDNAEELHDLYDNLLARGYEVEITIKPKAAKATDMDDENSSFEAQLAAYPEGTEITFTLTQDE